MEAKRIRQGFWIKRKLMVVENVPAGLCPQCGEKAVRADVGRRLAVLPKYVKARRKVRTRTVPVLAFTED